MEKDTTETVRTKTETETVVDSGMVNLLRAERLAETRHVGFAERAINLLNTLFYQDYLIAESLSVSSDRQKYVLKATRRGDGIECAIKALVMPSFYSPIEQSIKTELFEAETDLTDGLNKILHGKGIIRVVECGRKYLAKPSSQDGKPKLGVLPLVIPYLITEFAKGGTVEDLNVSEDTRNKVRIFREVAETMSFIHECYNLVHRDIKPSNLMLAEGGASKIIDWEAATVMGQRQRNHEIGSMLYFSPNHARGMIAIRDGKESPAHDYRSDMYPLGLSLGNTLFKGHFENPVDVMRDYFGDHLEDYCEFIASDPDLRFPSSGIAALDDILHRTVSNKNDRFKSMKELAQALSSVECKL